MGLGFARRAGTHGEDGTGERKRWCRAAAMAVLGLGAVMGRARGDDTQVPEFRLGEVVVTGSAPRIVDQATTVQEVTAADIAAKGARTLDEALDLLPGLFIRVGGDGTPRMDIRGLRTRNILLLLDGVPLNSTFDNQWDPTLIPVENIARIKMTRGASSVLYGDGGNAGVINIITKRGQRGLRATLSVEAGRGARGELDALSVAFAFAGQRQVFERADVRVGELGDVDVVTDGRAIGRGIVGSIDFHARDTAHCGSDY